MTDLNYTIKDFKSENEVRWCAGCGDFAIMNAVQRTMAGLGIQKKNMQLFPVLDVLPAFLII